MNTSFDITTNQDPQSAEMNLQERSCDPTPDSSLPADAVFADRLNDPQGSASAVLYVP